MDNGNNQFMLKLIALLNQQKSKTAINADIKELEKVISKIKLIATISKGNSKTEINQAIKQLETQLRQIKLQAKIDNRQLNRQIDSALRNVSARDINLNINEGRMNTQVRRVVAQARNYVDSNPISVNIDLKKEKLLNQLATFMNKHTRINESSYWLNEAERVRTVISSISNRTDLRNATDELQVFTSGVRATGYATLSTTDRIKGMLGNIVKVGNYFGIAYIAINKFKESLNNLKEMDTIFTEISKTTDLTTKKLQELSEASYAIASKYGVLASNFATSLQEMSRAGFGDGQATELAELATLAQSAGAITSDLANQYLIASNAAYGYAGNVEKLNALLDSQNQVTNRNAVSMEQLAEATKVAANQLSNSNISEAEMTALLGTGIATTQEEGSVVGRAVKGIVMNLQQVENTDEGFETTEEDLGKVESRLESLGIQMKETANGITALRNPMEILEELAEVYNSLPANSAERANIISDIGGKYRGNILSSILSNWATLEKMLNDYEDAEGSALRESQKSADSWEGRLAQLQNSWDSFVSSVTSKNAIKGGISFLDNTIQGFEKLTDTLGAIPVILTTINTSMAALNKNYGITQLFNKSTGKIDVQGSFMGIDITSWKAQTKHFREATSAIAEWNQEMASGTANIATVGNATVQNNEQLKAYLQTTSADAPASLNGYKAYLNAAGVSTDALRLKTVLLTSALTMGLSLGIQALVTGFSKLANVEAEVREKAQELGDTFSNTESDIEDYKDKIVELYETISDSGSSIEDVTAARQNLMEIQDELIDKFGIEKESIELITEAINGQSDALDVLTRKQWQAIKNEFNDSGFWEDTGNFFSGYSDNIDRMLNEYGEYSTRIDMSIFSKTGKWNSEETEKALKELEKIGVTIDRTEAGIPFAELSGNATEVYNQLLAIQDLFSDESLGASDSFQKHLTSLANSAEDVSSKYEDLYKQYILYEEIFADDTYAKSFNAINKAYSDYQDAFATGNEERIQKAKDNFANVITQATEGVTDESVVDYFNGMYPDLQEVVSQWQFETNFTANTEGLKESVEGYLSDLDGLYSTDLLNFSYETATDEQKAAYDGLVSAARLYGLEINQLIEKLIAMGLIQNENYQHFVELFGQDNVDSLSTEDLEIAYSIKNVGDMTFDELIEAIEEAKKVKYASFSDVFNSSDFANAKEELLDLAKSGELMAETIESTEDYKTLLKQTGLSAEEAKSKILDTLTTWEQLDGASQGLGKLSKAYEEFKENGYVTANTLESLPDVFKQLDGYDFSLFEDIVGDATSTKKEIQSAFDDILSYYISSQKTLKGITEENKQIYITQLEQMGVENAKEAVNEYLVNQETVKNILDDYEKYIDAKGEADLDYLTNLAGNNTELVNALTSTYSTDYNNWVDLLNQKAVAYNKFIAAIKNSQDATLSSAVITDDAKAKEIVSNYEKFGSKDGIKTTGSLPTSGLGSSLNGLNSQGNTSNSLSNLAKYSEAEYQSAKNYLASIEQVNALKESLQLDLSTIDTDFGGSFTGTSSSSKSDSKSEKSFDWIETELSNMTDELDKLDDKVSDTYSTWTARNKALADSISKTKEAIALQNKAYNAYMSEANAVGLSDTYKKLVQKGALDIETITDEDLADKISEYQDLYEKAQDCLKTADELQQTLNELSTSEKWDLIKTETDADISKLDYSIDAMQTAQDKLEMMGKYARTDAYESMYSTTQSKISVLKNQSNQLSSILGSMTQGTEAYDTLFEELLGIRQEISELENDCIEFNNNIRDLNWEVFEYLEDSISRITDEMDYLIDLIANEDLFNDNGKLTEYADATIALHAASYDVYKQQAEDYKEEMLDLQAQLVNGNMDVLEQYRKMQDAHQDAVNAANEEKQAILDLIKDGYEAQLDALNEVIDKKKESLNLEKETYDYQNSINDLVDERDSLQKQILAYKNDTSESGRSTLQQLESKLADVEENLQQTEYEKYLNDQEQMLDALSSEYEQWQNERLDNEDALLQEIISGISTEGDEINATLNEVAEKNGTLISDSITSIFSSDTPFTNGLANISDGVAGTTAAINTLIAQVSNIAGILGSTNAGTSSGKGSTSTSSTSTSSSTSTTSGNSSTKSNTSSSSATSSSAQSSTKSSTANADGIFIYRKDNYPKDKLNKENSIVDRCKYNNFASDFSSRAIYYSKLGGSGTYRGSASQNRWLINKMKERGYKKGSSNIPYDQMNWIHDGEVVLERVSDNGLLFGLPQGSKVFTKEMSDNLWNLSQMNLPTILPDINLPTLPEFQSKQTQVTPQIHDVNMTFELPNVKDTDEFINDLIESRRFEKAVQEMTLGQGLGRNSLNKHRYLK